MRVNQRRREGEGSMCEILDLKGAGWLPAASCHLCDAHKIAILAHLDMQNE